MVERKCIGCTAETGAEAARHTIAGKKLKWFWWKNGHMITSLLISFKINKWSPLSSLLINPCSRRAGTCRLFCNRYRLLGKYVRLLTIQHWLVSTIFGFMFAYFLQEDEAGDTFRPSVCNVSPTQLLRKALWQLNPWQQPDILMVWRQTGIT